MSKTKQASPPIDVAMVSIASEPNIEGNESSFKKQGKAKFS